MWLIDSVWLINKHISSEHTATQDVIYSKKHFMRRHKGEKMGAFQAL